MPKVKVYDLNKWAPLPGIDEWIMKYLKNVRARTETRASVVIFMGVEQQRPVNPAPVTAPVPSVVKEYAPNPAIAAAARRIFEQSRKTTPLSDAELEETMRATSADRRSYYRQYRWSVMTALANIMDQIQDHNCKHPDLPILVWTPGRWKFFLRIPKVIAPQLHCLFHQQDVMHEAFANEETFEVWQLWARPSTHYDPGCDAVCSIEERLRQEISAREEAKR